MGRAVRTALTGVAMVTALLTGCAGGEPDPPAQPPASTAPPTTPAAPGPAARPSGVARDVPVRDAQVAAPAPAPAPPVRVRYEELDLDMAVLPVGVADDGQMEIPEDAAEAGWYRFGPTAGAGGGSTVVAAHSGSQITPRGPFHDFEESSRPGDRVEVVLEDGTAVPYEVTEVVNIGKAAIVMDPYFRREGAHQLVLITCGGRWDAVRGSYDANVVVTARPLGR